MPSSNLKPDRVLLFGGGGKLGTALQKALAPEYELLCPGSGHVDATHPQQVEHFIRQHRPAIIINAAAHVGIDPCEQNPGRACLINTLFPKLLAELSAEMGFVLAQISTDAVFDGKRDGFFTEEDLPRPLNIYGLSKFGGDCFTAALARQHYIFRIPLLFGKNLRQNQFVEKMHARIGRGAKTLRIADDIVTSPSFSEDVARAIHKAIEARLPYGLYHIANDGRASLYDLMTELVRRTGVPVEIQGCPHTEFPSLAHKNTYSPLASVRLRPMRPWQEALAEYCSQLKNEVAYA